jgi:alcohol dehydrogenase
VTLMTALIRSGLLDLRRIDSKTFSLDHANEAVSHAAANGGPFGMTVIQP